MPTEKWNTPGNYNELVAGGDTQYSILGVLTQNNMDSMQRFVGAVDGLEDRIEEDSGTQIVVSHPDITKIIFIDAGGLGDFYDSGFDVTVTERDVEAHPVPECLKAEHADMLLREAAPDLLAALHEGRRAIGDHFAPSDCYATGPVTGDPIRDLVLCPACSFIEMYDRAIAKAAAA